MPRATKTAGRLVASWNIDKLIDSFSGVEPLIVAHRDFGFAPLTYSQVAHWKCRHQVPSERLAELFVVLHATDRSAHAVEFIRSRGQPR